MTSPAYRFFRDAIVARRPIACDYQGLYRELCPHVLGHTKGEEVVLAFQFAGDSSKGLPPGGEWKCLRLAKVANARLSDGPWRTGASHRQAQSCVQVVEYDVNPASPYKPRRGRGG
jgi:hypothetical protein